jgi:hypothetical protein
MKANFGAQRPDVVAPEHWSSRLVLHGSLPVVWTHCGATAELLSELYAGQAARAGKDENEAHHGINYLTNELLENAVKFRHAVANSIELDASFSDGVFEIRVRNHAEKEVATCFGQLLEQLNASDPSALLLERIEANAVGDSPSASGLGILTLMSDYGAEFTWQFEQLDAAAPVMIQTHASLRL